MIELCECDVTTLPVAAGAGHTRVQSPGKRPAEEHVMASEPRRYLAYLLRVWRVTNNDGVPAVRASLEDVHTGARQGFGSLELLLAFLLKEMAGASALHTDPEEHQP